MVEINRNHLRNSLLSEVIQISMKIQSSVFNFDLYRRSDK